MSPPLQYLAAQLYHTQIVHLRGATACWSGLDRAEWGKPGANAWWHSGRNPLHS